MRGRTLSAEDPRKAAMLRRRVQKDVRLFPGQPPFLWTMAAYTLLLSFAGDPDMPSYLYASLLDKHYQNDLEQMKVINWHGRFYRLMALSTKGDGNCLLHALSLCVWGVHDTETTLRGLLSTALQQDQEQGRFYRRFRLERSQELRQQTPVSLTLDSLDWESEWRHVLLTAAVPTPNEEGRLIFPHLEAIHIFVMANILRRPIIVLSANHIHSLHGTQMAENYMQGIYLPLLWNSSECNKSPLVIGHHMNHFAALVPIEPSPTENRVAAVPLVRADSAPLKIHFLLEDEQTKCGSLLRQYIEVTSDPVLSATWTFAAMPAALDLLQESLTLSPSASEWSRLTPPPATRSSSDPGAEELYMGSAMPSAPLEPTVSQAASLPPSGQAASGAGRVGLVNQHSQSAINQLSMPEPPSPTDNQLQPSSMPVVSGVGETRLLSIMEVRCPVEGCEFMASSNTFPYCHEHQHLRGQVHGSTGGQVELPSMTEEECHFPSCRFYTTRGTHPYCHVHKEEPVRNAHNEKCLVATCALETTRDTYPFCHEHGGHRYTGSGGESPGGGARQLSVMNEKCAIEGCTFQASRYTYPYCHEHNPAVPPPHSANAVQPPEQTHYQSLLPSNCAAPHCTYNASRTTAPYCHEHAEQRTPSNIAPPEQYTLSVTDSRCAAPNCHFFASHFTHPYCHEHNPTAMSEQPPSDPQYMSLMDRHCDQPGCEFYTSENTYPYCYEHAEERPRVRRRSSDERHSWSGTFPRMPSERSQASVDDATRRQCLVPSCPFLGYTTLAGLCAQHYERHYHSPSPPSSAGTPRYPSQGRTSLGREDPQYNAAVRYENHIANYNPCLYPGCTEVGLDVNNGLCWNCFGRKSLIESRRPVRLNVRYSSTLPRPGGSPREWGNAHAPTDFRRAMKEVEDNSRSAAAKCRNEPCSNYGNSGKAGFCNSCYIKRTHDFTM